MKRSHDPLALSLHWHIDCRIEDELPDDNVVGTRFLINVVFGGAAVAAIIYTGLLLAQWLSLGSQIRDWEQRISDNRAEVRDIKRMQLEYSAEAVKIDQAYALVRPFLNVSSFISNIGRTRPEQLVIDTIEWNDAGVFVRGSLHETPERATHILGDYVKLLGDDEKIGPLFREIVLTGFMRGTSEDVHNYEISFRLHPGP
jgi:hypothetical protein